MENDVRRPIVGDALFRLVKATSVKFDERYRRIHLWTFIAVTPIKTSLFLVARMETT